MKDPLVGQAARPAKPGQARGLPNGNQRSTATGCVVTRSFSKLSNTLW